MGAMKNLQIELYNQGLWECPNSGMLIPLGQDAISEEEMAQMEKEYALSERDWYSSQSEVLQEQPGDGF